MDDSCHRHIIWAWNRGDAEYHSVQEETRCLYMEPTYTEYDAQEVYNSNITKAQGRMVRQGYGGIQTVAWPGGVFVPADKYIVAILRWNPPANVWDWQQWTEVVPDVKSSFVMSATDQAVSDSALGGLDLQVQNLPVPDAGSGNVPDAVISNKAGTIALLVGGGVIGLGLLMLSLRAGRG